MALLVALAVALLVALVGASIGLGTPRGTPALAMQTTPVQTEAEAALNAGARLPGNGSHTNVSNEGNSGNQREGPGGLFDLHRRQEVRQTQTSHQPEMGQQLHQQTTFQDVNNE